jgi:hypothetical protein
MTVEELIEKLQEMPQELDVQIFVDGARTDADEVSLDGEHEGGFLRVTIW